jgi:hypothetical protein
MNCEQYHGSAKCQVGWMPPEFVEGMEELGNVYPTSQGWHTTLADSYTKTAILYTNSVYSKLFPSMSLPKRSNSSPTSSMVCFTTSTVSFTMSAVSTITATTSTTTAYPTATGNIHKVCEYQGFNQQFNQTEIRNFFKKHSNESGEWIDFGMDLYITTNGRPTACVMNCMHCINLAGGFKAGWMNCESATNSADCKLGWR